MSAIHKQLLFRNTGFWFQSCQYFMHVKNKQVLLKY
jgi:hypothetical protein